MDSNRDHAFSAIIRQSARTAGVYRTRDVERIAAGRQPPELTAQVLRAGRLDIRVDWTAQKRALGTANYWPAARSNSAIWAIDSRTAKVAESSNQSVVSGSAVII